RLALLPDGPAGHGDGEPGPGRGPDRAEPAGRPGAHDAGAGWFNDRAAGDESARPTRTSRLADRVPRGGSLRANALPADADPPVLYHLACTSDPESPGQLHGGDGVVSAVLPGPSRRHAWRGVHVVRVHLPVARRCVLRLGVRGPRVRGRGGD